MHKLPANALANSLKGAGWVTHPIDEGQTCLHLDPRDPPDPHHPTPRITLISIDQVLIGHHELHLVHPTKATTQDKVRLSSNFLCTALVAGLAVTDRRTPLHRHHIPQVLERTLAQLRTKGVSHQQSPATILCAKCQSRPAASTSPLHLCDRCTPPRHPKNDFRKKRRSTK